MPFPPGIARLARRVSTVCRCSSKALLGACRKGDMWRSRRHSSRVGLVEEPVRPDSIPGRASVMGATDLPYHVDALSLAVLGMRDVSASDNPEARTAFADAAALLGTLGRPPTRVFLVRLISGLQSSSDRVPEVRTLLSALRPPLSAARGFTSAQIGVMLYSLRCCSSNSEETRAILSALTYHVSRCSEAFSPRSLCSALFGLRSMSSSHAEVRALLAALAPHIVTRVSEPLCAVDVAQSLNGLQGCSSDEPEVRGVLAALAPRLATCIGELSGREAGLALHGLRRCSSQSPEVQSALTALLPLVRSVRGDLTAIAVANALGGLAQCSTRDAHVVGDLLAALAPRVARCPERLTGHALATALGGLQGCHSSQWQTRLVLQALADKARGCSDVLSPAEIALALHGLRHCSTARSEVRAVLRALAPLLRPRKGAPEQVMSCDEIGRALLGLQGCSSGAEETRAVLAELEPWIRACPPASWDSGDILSALYGLQSCSTAHAEVRDVLAALQPAIDAISAPMPAFRAALGLYGLQSCEDSPPVRAVIASLARCTDLSAAALASLPAQGVSMALMGLAGAGGEAASPFLDAVVPRAVQLTTGGAASSLSSDDLCALVIGTLALCPQAAPAQRANASSRSSGESAARLSGSRRYASPLAQVYAACVAELSGRSPRHWPEGSAGGAEATLRRFALEAFAGDSAVTVHPTATFLHGVEADIVLSVSRGGGRGTPAAIVNIEVDGVASNEERSRRVAAVRDAHLLRQGVHAVIRWDTSADRGLPMADDFKSWIRRGVQTLRV